MTIKDQIRDEKLEYDINREAAKISALSSGETRKYQYLPGEDILPSDQQQIREQAKFTYSPLGKAFEKQIKTIEDQGQKQVDALENLKPKEETRPIENNLIINEKLKLYLINLLKKEKKMMNELYDSVDYNNLKFEYVGTTKDVNFYEYMNSKDLFNAIKNFEIKFSVVKNKQDEFLKKLNNIKIGKKKTIEQKETINNLVNFIIPKKKLLIFLQTILKCYLMLITIENKMKLREKGLRY